MKGLTLKDIAFEYNVPLKRLVSRRDYLVRVDKLIKDKNFIQGSVYSRLECVYNQEGVKLILEGTESGKLAPRKPIPPTKFVKYTAFEPSAYAVYQHGVLVATGTVTNIARELNLTPNQVSYRIKAAKTCLHDHIKYREVGN